MPMIQLTGSDSAAIALALISDRINAQQAIPLRQLENEWSKLGLRSDDLIQGIATLRREQKLRLDSDTDPLLQISESTIAVLPMPGKGLISLDKRLQTVLEAAKARQCNNHADNIHADNKIERRQGFK